MSFDGEEVQPLYDKDFEGDGSTSEHFAWEQEEDRKSPLAQNQYTMWRRMALLVCALSIVCEIVLGVISLVYGLKKQSVGTFGFALDAFLDIITTCVVIWRFMGKGEEATSWAREVIALQAFGILFVLSGTGLSIKAIRDLVLERKPTEPLLLVGICGASAVVFAVMTIAKWFVGKKIKSRALKLDALNSACCCVLVTMLLISLLIYKYTGFWGIGHGLSLMVAAFLICYGSWCLYNTIIRPMVQKKIMGPQQK